MQFNKYNLFLFLTIQNYLGILEIATNFLLHAYYVFTQDMNHESANSFESK